MRNSARSQLRWNLGHGRSTVKISSSPHVYNTNERGGKAGRDSSSAAAEAQIGQESARHLGKEVEQLHHSLLALRRQKNHSAFLRIFWGGGGDACAHTHTRADVMLTLDGIMRNTVRKIVTMPGKLVCGGESFSLQGVDAQLTRVCLCVLMRSVFR